MSEVTSTKHALYTALVTFDATNVTVPDEIAPIILKSCADALYKSVYYLCL